MEKGEEGGENMYTKVNCVYCAHLPCKVGDTAYFVSAVGVHDFTVGTVMAEVSEDKMPDVEIK